MQSLTLPKQHLASDCECNSTNQELMQLILQSPLFPVVEDLCKSTLRAEAERPVVRKERVDIQVLDRLLDQIMTGKYSMLRE